HHHSSSPPNRGGLTPWRWRWLAGFALFAVVAFALFHPLMRLAPGAAEGSPGVVFWWSALSAVGATNLVAWAWVSRMVRRHRAAIPPDIAAQRRWQIVLCGLYVAGCALRSFFPKADVQRICLVDSIWSSVLVGRSIATIAELSFVAQWTLLLSEYARET